MAYNFDKLNTINIWNIYDKVLDDNAAIKFCQRYRLLRQTPNCAIHGTAYVLEKHNNTYKWVCYRKGHQCRPCLREGSVVKALWNALRRRHKYGATSGNQYAARRCSMITRLTRDSLT